MGLVKGNCGCYWGIKGHWSRNCSPVCEIANKNYYSRRGIAPRRTFWSVSNKSLVHLDANSLMIDYENVFYYTTDITSNKAIIESSERIRQDHGNPSVLINNAGVANGKTILEESEDERRRVFNVDILAHFSLVREFLPDMIKHNHGHIVTVASTASFLARPQLVSYSCCKTALIAFHEGLSQELRMRHNARKVRTT
ncbi:hypothetical protein COCC4DRAFT_155403 [Bipolaris maydis ATCC 48331]|uniref:Dehydrogenase RED3 n=1 Tax=Cochliobolus heterostrophus (strain C4 / ATCC 48331 / race T) TaxID=665024 RepID=RED3_COCH4|nr:uncharacterized protein COCC4DRAFT_155403 [Bipolaris maydis ATCC 48331]N4WW42.1 RecName: Full=Dehydrogenase RED3; AltName: Full=T-toxin biosynthesis protein RED3 [Bipolaris maydis ATCC 48331]ACP34153.1 putative short chain dehydrogenase [Bipolaris maydis]ENH98580.1 hypothetical protein COCC4DRAFT_155403 [Bipolaris maydis ATCC 48331]KAJ5026271.1 hypothetical protein J3E73DRAFT_391505 [Bipolaris maydis]KAJ5051353.1 putative short chain dehydrogenase [Bipolaris maydis]KAJ6196397.1 putative sh